MFLKQIRLQGFKSFANKTVINFESDYTGIVGPNGCGKSNIIDAIKWVFGEQSAKNMRGSQMSDIVFSGAEGKKGVNMAEVTLVIDNHNHVLNSDYDQLEVTRRLYKASNESEYLLNNQPCRLKDVIDLTLDSGIGKDSLSIISQGTVQSFAEAKPIDRRALFEEAAGVAKYKSRKIESLNKLNRTQENIERVSDIYNELESRIGPLKRAAAKAVKYAEKKGRLTQIEVGVIVHEVQSANEELAKLQQQLFDLEYQDTTIKASISMADTQANDLKDEINRIDNEVHVLQDKLLKILNEIQSLEKRKVEVDEKRRYIRETGSDEAKAAETKKLLNDALKELQDRESRRDKAQASIDLLEKNIADYNIQLSKLKDSLEKNRNTYHHLSNRKSVLENLAKSPYEKEAGVKSIIANRNALDGIMDVVSECFKADEGYETMATVALSNAMFHIITKDEASARNAIRFLKKNRTGTATFLPLTLMKPRQVPNDHLFICENTHGFLGLASDFIDCEEKYDVVVLSLLGNVLVCDELENANALAKRLNYGYKIVTVDGDIVFKGGTMAGGYNRLNDSPLTYQIQLADVEKKMAKLSEDIDEDNRNYNNISKMKSADQGEVVSQKVSLASLCEVLGIKKSKYEELKDEYEQMKPVDAQQQEDYSDKLIGELNRAYALKDEITNTIAKKRERRVEANNEYQKKYADLREYRNNLALTDNQINAINIAYAKLQTNKDNILERLARDYSMTYEYAQTLQYDVDMESAKDEVRILREEIANLGNVNPDAPEEYRSANERYEFLSSQLADLNGAKEKLLSVINEMDEIMTRQFMESFEKINLSLNEAFTTLFGGGKARLELEDEDDILNSGIDITVQPPGKTIQNIRLFSGGEKSLIAICVLFAILKARPVPLCIFDEVEASLDQGNVEKYARYIHEFSDETQFIVITHRPGTMTQCDILYGVTMQHKGISNVLRVKLKEAVSMIEEGKNGTVSEKENH